MLGQLADFLVRGRNGEVVTTLPNRFVDPTSLVEFMEHAAPCIEYEFESLGRIWPCGTWGKPNHPSAMSLGPDEYNEIRTATRRGLLSKR